MGNYSNEIDELKKNQIHFKIKRVEGYIVKINSFNFYLKWYYQRRKKSKKCWRTGLEFDYFVHKQANICFVFTECPIYDFQDQHEVDSKEGCVVVTVYESAEDFMATETAGFLRRYFTDNSVCSWDEFGYFRTDSKVYNRIPIVKAISELRPNKQIKRMPPVEPKGIADYLFK